MVPANTSGLEVKDIAEVPGSIWSTVIKLIASTARSAWPLWFFSCRWMDGVDRLYRNGPVEGSVAT
jgi:hypothetical protein